MKESGSRTSTLALAALGVVFGDIGTSPLYTIKEVFSGPHHPLPVNPGNVLGILSVVFWSLAIVISLKYVLIVLRADNKGEGGSIAIMALVQRALGAQRSAGLLLLGLFGAALFYGDCVITPAISVLSAIEGLEVATPAFKPYVVPMALGVLAVLFAVQKNGTASVGKLFGPVMVVWFSVLAILGLIGIVEHPGVLAAINPAYAVQFFVHDPAHAFFSLGAAVLALTGGEALYADMGHFGRKPVRLAWYCGVMPALVLNYFGQGALVLSDPKAITNPFFMLAPEWAIYPLVVLAMAATIIASQAVISGAYSLTRQAIQLGFFPRMEVEHTSRDEIGQIYLPGVNWALLVAVSILVIGFGSSSRLAAAYGIAVTGTMVITTILTCVVAWNLWRWHKALCLLFFGSLLVIDLAYFAANAIKLADGGWFPVVLGLVMFTIMTTWRRGRALVHKRLEADAMPMSVFVESMVQHVPTVPGTAIFMTGDPLNVPHAMLHSLKHYKCLHEKVIILTVETLEEAYVSVDRRVRVESLRENFHTVTVTFGYMDMPDLPAALKHCSKQGLEIDMMDTSFFLGRETLIPKFGSELAYWREKLFIAMFRNARAAAAYFQLPPNRVVELGAQVVL